MSLNHYHFGIFIGLSLLMHAVLFSIVPRDNTTLLVHQPVGTLDVELIATKSVASDLQQPAVQQNKPRSHQQSPAVNAQQTVAAPKQDASPLIATDDFADHQLSDTTNRADTGTISKKIAIEFLRYFYYPDVALRRNWQGDVILQFTLLPDGHLDHIRIHQSSGYKALDDAAIHALQQVEPQQELALLTDTSLLHILPVSYRLTNPL